MRPFFSREYGNDSVGAGPVAAREASGEPDTFQRLKDFLGSSSEQSISMGRDKVDINGFDVLDSLASRRMDNNSTVIQHPMMNTMLGTATGAAVGMKAVIGQPDVMKQLNAVLNNSSAPKPLEKVKQGEFSANAETLNGAANNKADAMQDKMRQLQVAKDAVTQKAPAAQGKSGLGGAMSAIATELAFGAIGLPGAGIAMSAVKAMVGGPNIEGQGTFSSQKTASAPLLSKREERASAGRSFSYGFEQAPAPQVIAAPTATTAMNRKMSSGPGFGPTGIPGNDIGARVSLAGQGLEGIKIGNMDKMIENSPAMKAAKSGLEDATSVKTGLKGLENDGFLAKDGKQRFAEFTQELIKAPARPAAPSYRL